MKHKILFGIIFLIVFTIMATGCAEPIKIVDPQLESNRRLWQESKIVNYNFTNTRLQGGMRSWVPVLIKVRNGAMNSMESISERGEAEKVEGYGDFDTAEKMFDQIQESYNDGDKVIVTYNKEFGYPENIRIETPNAGVDAGFSILISEFEVIRTN